MSPHIGIAITTDPFRQPLVKEYKTVYDAMIVKPSCEISRLQNTLIKTLVNSCIFPAKTVRLFLLGSHSIGETIVDFVDPTRKATFVLQPDFYVNSGLVGAGSITTSYLDLGFNPSTESDKYTQNSAGYGIFINSNVDGIYSEIGQSDGTNYSFLNPKNSNTINCLLNEAVTNWNTGINNTDSRGFYFVTRRGVDGATKRYVYKNKTETAINSNSAGIINKNYFGLCYNNNGTATQHSTRRNGLIIITSGLTTTEENILSDAVNAYFTGVALASWPYLLAIDSYKTLAISNPLLKYYLSGVSINPIIGTNIAAVIGSVTFTDDGLGNDPKDKSIRFALNTDMLELTNNSVYNFGITDKWTVDFLINYSGVGYLLNKSLAGIGWGIFINADRRIEANMIHDLGGEDYVVQQSTEQLTQNQTYHVCVQFNPSTQNAYGFDSTPKIIIFINGREQLTYPQYEPKAYRSLVGDITNAGTLSIGNGFVGLIDEIAIWSGLGNAKNIQARAFMQVNSFSVPSWTRPTSIVNLILDQDIDSDPDDAGDIHTAIALKRLGEINLLGDIISTATPFASPSAQAIADWWNETILVAQYQGAEGRKASDPSALNCYSNLRDTFRAGDERTQYPDDIVTYRTLLAAAANNSVVIITTGYLISIWGLMLSAADGISPLTGLELLTAKVDTIFVVGNYYPDGIDTTPEYNAAGHPVSWKYVIENAPCKIIFAGAEFGFPIIKGAPIKDPDDFATNPFRYAYYFGLNDTRPVWGVLPQLMAARGMTIKFILSYPFTQTINGTTGLPDNLVYSSSGNRWFLRYADGFDTAYSGNDLGDDIDAIFAMDNTTNP